MNSSRKKTSVIILSLALCLAVAGAAACAMLNNDSTGDGQESTGTTEFIEYIQSLPDNEPDQAEGALETGTANIWAPLENGETEAKPENDNKAETETEKEAETVNDKTEKDSDYVIPSYDRVIFIGDSRTVQLEMAVSYNRSKTVFIGESGMGYQWFSETAVFQADGQLGPYDSAIVINMGVNDLGDVKRYAQLVNRKAAEWKLRGATVYYASVTPVIDGYTTVTNAEISDFNETLKGLLSSDVFWIDTYSYFMKNGYTATDGLHYDNATYKSLYAYYHTVFTER